MFHVSKKNSIFCLFIVLIIGITATVSYTYGRSSNNAETPEEDKNVHTIRIGKSDLTNPILDCEVDQNYYTNELKQFKSTVSDFVEKNKSEGEIDDAGVYFRDLQDGPWFSINGNVKFAPASLLKVPIMMAYFKLAETDSSILQKKISYDSSYPFPDENKIMYYKPQKTIEKGKDYTVDELLQYMILYSDNNAKNLLELNLPVEDEAKVYTDLGLPNIIEPTGAQPEDVLSVQDNARFYRVLYNASYLNRQYSQKALQLLVDDNFTGGIQQGMPPSLKFANKFGERAMGDQRQLHDCGIVYYPTNPYILCVMTRGNDFQKLSSFLGQLSHLVLVEVNKQVKYYPNLK